MGIIYSKLFGSSGNASSEDPECIDCDEKARLTSRKIDISLKKENWARQNVVKLLLLGTAESGKSTLARQLTLIKGGGYAVEERNAFKPKVFENAITSLATILSAMSTYKIKFEDPKRFFEGMLL